jgi:DNA-nicking Smr family endonuclease
MAGRGPKHTTRASPDKAVDKPADPAAMDDVRAFRDAVRDVKPHRHEPRIRPAVKPARARPAAAAVSPHSAHEEDPGIYPTVEGTEPLVFRRAGVREAVMRKLKRGLIPVEDALDLHGLTQAAARDLLEDFLDEQHRLGHRCVRIVHGKGYRSGARGPVLKMLVNGWLRRRTDVIAFHSARTIDGGTGAVYVLLHA